MQVPQPPTPTQPPGKATGGAVRQLSVPRQFAGLGKPHGIGATLLSATPSQSLSQPSHISGDGVHTPCGASPAPAGAAAAEVEVSPPLHGTVAATSEPPASRTRRRFAGRGFMATSGRARLELCAGRSDELAYFVSILYRNVTHCQNCHYAITAATSETRHDRGQEPRRDAAATMIGIGA